MTLPSDGRLQQIKDGGELAAPVAAWPLLRRRPPTPSVVYDPHPTLCLPTVPRVAALSRLSSILLISRPVVSCYARRGLPLPRVVRNVDVVYNRRRNYFHADGNCWAKPCFTAMQLSMQSINRPLFIVEKSELTGPKFELLSMWYMLYLWWLPIKTKTQHVRLLFYLK